MAILATIARRCTNGSVHVVRGPCSTRTHPLLSPAPQTATSNSVQLCNTITLHPVAWNEVAPLRALNQEFKRLFKELIAFGEDDVPVCGFVIRQGPGTEGGTDNDWHQVCAPPSSNPVFQLVALA